MTDLLVVAQDDDGSWPVSEDDDGSWPEEALVRKDDATWVPKHRRSFLRRVADGAKTVLTPVLGALGLISVAALLLLATLTLTVAVTVVMLLVALEQV